MLNGVSERRTFRDRLRAGEVLTAIFSIIPSPTVVEILALAGFNAVIVDMEHGPTSLGDLVPLLMGVEAGGAHAVVRVPECSEHVIGAVLDMGAEAVLVPQVVNAAQARRAVSAARYAPDGTRGVNPWVRAARYGRRSDWVARSNEHVAVMVMIEGSDGLAQLDAILEVPGLDGIFLGPVDMAYSMGVPGQPDHPRVIEAIARAAQKARSLGISVGVFSRDPAGASNWIGKGPTFLAVAEDTYAILDAVTALRDAIKIPK